MWTVTEVGRIVLIMLVLTTAAIYHMLSLDRPLWVFKSLEKKYVGASFSRATLMRGSAGKPLPCRVGFGKCPVEELELQSNQQTFAFFTGCIRMPGAYEVWSSWATFQHILIFLGEALGRSLLTS